MTSAHPPTEPLSPGLARFRTALYAVGAVAAAYGLVSLVISLGGNVIGWAIFVLAGVVLHDGVIAPLAAGLGAGLKHIPSAAYGFVVGGLMVTGMVVAASLPVVLRLGESADLPSFLPRSYGSGLLITLVAVWVGVGLLALVRTLRRRSA